MSEANNITSLPPENKTWYNTLYLAGKVVCKRDEKISSLLCFDIKLLYGRCAKEDLSGFCAAFFYAPRGERHSSARFGGGFKKNALQGKKL